MGIKQHFIMNKFDWSVTIYYTVDSLQKTALIAELKKIGCSADTLYSINKNLDRAGLDTGFTYSNYDSKSSIIVIHKASSIGEFINTFEHEKNHLEMHMCEALDINPYSEKAAILSGDLAQTIVEKALYSIAAL